MLTIAIVFLCWFVVALLAAFFFGGMFRCLHLRDPHDLSRRALLFLIGMTAAFLVVSARAQTCTPAVNCIKTVPLSGSGSAATIADGANVTFGAKADARNTATDTTPITFMQVAKEISFMLQTGPVPVSLSSLPAFTAIPAFKTDQTTHGTTDKVASDLTLLNGGAAAALADGVTNPTTFAVGVDQGVFNGTTWDRQRSATIGNNVAATGIAAAAAYAQYNTATQSTTAANYAALQADARGNLLVSLDHTNRFSCVVAVSTATTITAFGGSCAAPGAGLSLYITDINANTNAAGIAADSFMTIKSGTGGTCGTGTAVIWMGWTPAAAQSNVNQNLATPIKVAANSEICWINSTAGSKSWVVNGYIAP